ncbi:MAG: TldD/PmbA family protein [Elusimicrobia bacterium]|nr:TldD/PmbA family protein [Elusimicrobiota bacterium]
MTPDLAALADEAVAWMKGREPGVEAELYLSRTESRVLARREGTRESVETALSLGAGVRVVRDGRVGFACAGAAGPEILRELWRGAVAQLAYAEPEPGRALPAPRAQPDDEALADSLKDETVIARPWEELEARLAEAESAARGGAVRVLRAEISASFGETVVAGTRGTRTQERGSSVDVSVSTAAESGAEAQVGEGWRGARRFEALDAAAAGREARVRAAAGLGARRVRAGRRAVVFEPWVGAEILELLADPLSADEAQSGRSLLALRLGARVASSLVTLRDDPRLRGGPASALCDDEGVPTRDKALIERGVLREFLHDSATAARAQTTSNGCGYRSDWSDRPGPGPSNLRLEPGARTRESLLSDTTDGLLVLEVLGAHMVDTVSGEFSIGVSGFELERGAVGRAFNGAMLSGNLLDMLSRVDAVADDPVFYGGFAAPTFRVAALDVA